MPSLAASAPATSTVTAAGRRLLMQDTGQLWIFAGNGDGSFRHTSSIPVGRRSQRADHYSGKPQDCPDLLVGNGFGDVLHLRGKGDGTFQISGNRVSPTVVPNLPGPRSGRRTRRQPARQQRHRSDPSSGGSGGLPRCRRCPGHPTTQRWRVHWFLRLDKGATLPMPWS